LEARQILKNNYDDLGPFNVREIIVLALFFLLIILWALRDQEFLLGWGELIRNA
jgi:di/tricarboxylate transporter